MPVIEKASDPAEFESSPTKLRQPADEGTLETAPQKDMQKIKIEQHTFAGGMWFTGWLFTIGFLHLGFWQGLLAIAVWPYYLGIHFSPLAR